MKWFPSLLTGIGLLIGTAGLWFGRPDYLDRQDQPPAPQACTTARMLSLKPVFRESSQTVHVELIAEGYERQETMVTEINVESQS